MATQWLRRRWLLAACASALVLAACGGGSIVSKLSPQRIFAFGDGMADLGQNGTGRYTVNDGTVNNWTAFVANAFGVSLTPVSSGGTSYAQGNARVTATTDAAGNTGTPSIEQQVTRFLATNPTPGENDLVLVSGGTSDVIVQAQAAIAGTQTRDQMIAATGQAGRELAAQVRRLVDKGFNHVVVAGPYNLGRSPWAVNLNQGSLLEAASSRFNDQLLVSLVDLGAKVLYVDAALQYNLYTANPGSYDLTNVTTPVCTSIDSGPGIGTGAGQVNSRLCTTSTLVSGASYSNYLFADRVYPTPRGQRLFGDYAQSRIKERW